MRISTNTVYELGTTKISDLQAKLVKTQQQLSTQRRVLTPADDPVAAANILGITQSISINEQFATNRQNAKTLLSQQESILQSVTTLLQDVKTLVVTAGNGAMEDSQRQFLAAELRGRFEELLGLANSRDGAGNFMFGGYQIDSQPFSQTPGGAQYNGDQGRRMLQIGASRQIALNDAGSSVFQNIKTGNGKFLATPAATNSGTGVISPGAVVDGTALKPNQYSVEFSVVAGNPDVTTYQVFDLTADPGKTAPLAFPDPSAPPATMTTVPYVSGQAITFDGMQIDIKGAPANGDTFQIEPSTNQSIFETLNDLLTTLTTSSTGGAGQTKLANGLSVSNNNIDNALANVLQVRASVGTRLKEIDVLDSAGEDLNAHYTDAINKLQELDLAEAISNFTQQQIAFEAAQKSFLQISRLSLFNFI